MKNELKRRQVRVRNRGKSTLELEAKSWEEAARTRKGERGLVREKEREREGRKSEVRD